jgi:hypothetical protein
MSNLTFTGRFVKAYDEKSGKSKAGKDWNSIKFVLTTDDQYNPNMAFATIKVVDEVKAMGTGQEITVHYNIRCNEYNGNYYTSLDAWKIETGAVATPHAAHNTDENQDIPF